MASESLTNDMSEAKSYISLARKSGRGRKSNLEKGLPNAKGMSISLTANLIEDYREFCESKGTTVNHRIAEFIRSELQGYKSKAALEKELCQLEARVSEVKMDLANIDTAQDKAVSDIRQIFQNAIDLNLERLETIHRKTTRKQKLLWCINVGMIKIRTISLREALAAFEDELAKSSQEIFTEQEYKEVFDEIKADIGPVEGREAEQKYLNKEIGPLMVV